MRVLNCVWLLLHATALYWQLHSISFVKYEMCERTLHTCILLTNTIMSVYTSYTCVTTVVPQKQQSKNIMHKIFMLQVTAVS